MPPISTTPPSLSTPLSLPRPLQPEETFSPAIVNRLLRTPSSPLASPAQLTPAALAQRMRLQSPQLPMKFDQSSRDVSPNAAPSPVVTSTSSALRQHAFGVRRGWCSHASCKCETYRASGPWGGPCMTCQHFPAQHTNLGAVKERCCETGCSCDLFVPLPAQATLCANCGHIQHTEQTVHQWEIDPSDLVELESVGGGGRGTVRSVVSSVCLRALG